MPAPEIELAGKPLVKKILNIKTQLYMFLESANKTRIPLKICRFRLQVAESAYEFADVPYSYEFHNGKDILACFWSISEWYNLLANYL